LIVKGSRILGLPQSRKVRKDQLIFITSFLCVLCASGEAGGDKTVFLFIDFVKNPETGVGIFLKNLLK
jgi:hypothetical protein